MSNSVDGFVNKIPSDINAPSGLPVLPPMDVLLLDDGALHYPENFDDFLNMTSFLWGKMHDDPFTRVFALVYLNLSILVLFYCIVLASVIHHSLKKSRFGNFYQRANLNLMKGLGNLNYDQIEEMRSAENELDNSIGMFPVEHEVLVEDDVDFEQIRLSDDEDEIDDVEDGKEAVQEVSL